VADPARSYSLDLVGENRRVLLFANAAHELAAALVERGCSVVAVELDPTAAESAAQYASEVHLVDLDTDDYASKLSGRDFDVVLLDGVLERMRDPLGELRILRRLLVPIHGAMVLIAPNVAHVDVRLALLSGCFEYTETGILASDHVRFFTKASLEQLLAQAGLALTDVRGVVRPLFESGVSVAEREVAPGVLETLLRDPVAEFDQFVMRAVPLDAMSTVAALERRATELGHELREAAIDHADRITTLEREAEQAEDRAARALERAFRVARRLRDAELRVESVHAAVAAAVEAARTSQDAATRAASEVAALRRTRLVRWSTLPRRVYALLRPRSRA
jgi:O-antigen biosynthesis protein